VRYLVPICLLLLFNRPLAAEVQVHGGRCARIVSLAPSLTELLFALGLGERVVGVTAYCRYPEEAAAKAKVGALYDASYEALLRLSPSVVFMLDDNRSLPGELEKLGLRSESVSHRSLGGILESITTVGAICGVAERAAALRSSIEAEIDEIRSKTSGARRVRVLLVVGRGDTGPVARNVFVSGRDGFYSDLLSIAGGENVYAGVTAGVANLSPEALVTLRPEVIVEVIQDFKERGWSMAEIRRSWAPLDYIPAVKNGRIYVVSGDYAVIPGPRVARLLHDFAVLLHPELIK